MTTALGYLVWTQQENRKERKDRLTRQKVMEEALKGLLHEKIIKRCEQLLIIDEVTMEDINDLDYLAKPYFALDGNGSAEKAINRVNELKVVKEHKERLNDKHSIQEDLEND